MASSYTTNKKIEKPANGDYNNTWSTPVNADWDIIDRAFGGTTSLNAVSASGTVTLSTVQYQAPIVTITGSQTANINYQLPSSIGGFWFIFNNTTEGAGGPYAIVLSSAGGGSTVTLARGVTTAVICDGTNVGLANTSNALTATTAVNASIVTGTSFAIGYLRIPQSTNTTAAASDVGKHLYVSSSVTINASIFSAGDSFVIVNSNTATTAISVIAGSGVTLRVAGTTTSGTPRTITPNGMVSVLCVVGGATPTFLLSGAGLS
jgi:hypothetical protein